VKPLRRRHNEATCLNNVWSNAQAVEDYQDFLNGKQEKDTFDTDAVVVVGASTSDKALAACLSRLNPRGDDAVIEAAALVNGGQALPLEHPVTGATEFPVYLCVGASELVAVLDAAHRPVPDAKRDDLVFFSDGFIEPILKARGLCRKENTQAVLWLGFNSYGVPEDGRTSMGENANGIAEWAGESCVTGKWSGCVVERLGFGNLFCKQAFYRDWRRHMLEKVAYTAVVNLVGALHPYTDTDTPADATADATASACSLCSHRDVALYFAEEVRDMVDQVSFTLRGYMAVTLLLGAADRLLAFAEAKGGDMKCVVETSEFPYTNGLLWDSSMLARERGFPDTCAMHTEYVEYAVHKGLFELPKPK